MVWDLGAFIQFAVMLSMIAGVSAIMGARPRSWALGQDGYLRLRWRFARVVMFACIFGAAVFVVLAVVSLFWNRG